MSGKVGGSEDATRENPAQDPSLIICDCLTTYYFPQHFHSQCTIYRSVFGDACMRAVMLAHIFWHLSSVFSFSSPLSERVVTSTHCVAQVLERMKSVRLYHRMSIFCLCIVPVYHLSLRDGPMPRFWKVSTKFAYDSPINTQKRYWLCTNKTSIKIDRGRVIRIWRPWLRDILIKR